jgi:hypothetical protein
MKIQKADLILVGACSVAGFVFVLFPTHGNVTAAIVAGIPSGALGGCLACIFRRLLKQRQTRQQNNTPDGIRRPADGAPKPSV